MSGTARFGGFTPQVTAQMARPEDATPYSIGDSIAGSISFAVARLAGGSGRIAGGRCVVVAASGTVVLPAFDLLLFRPEPGVPFAADSYPADNAALNVPAASLVELVCVLSFSATAWRNEAGGATAVGATIYQTAAFATRPYAPFDLGSCGGRAILGLLQCQSAWDPGAVVNTFSFALDVDQD